MEDLISRQAVKEQMIKYGFHAPDMTVTEFVEDLLPSVQPKQKIDMVGHYKVITLCGSTRFKDIFLEIAKELTLQGYIVLMPMVFGHAGDIFTDDQKAMLDNMHKRKINMSDEIYVINKDGYIGSSTKSEIRYAQMQGKPVKYMEE